MRQKIIILVPFYCFSEIMYSINIVLGEFLGLEYKIKQENRSDIEILSPTNDSKLTINSAFFNVAHTNWLTHKSLPIIPLKLWNPEKQGLKVDLIEKNIPVLFGEPTLNGENKLSLGLDIFGSIFFSISRYEELVKLNKDIHDRFPAKASIAYVEDFLDRPIVDEYVEILWACLKLLWPRLARKKRRPNNFICCDVDAPFESTLYSLKTAIYQSIRELVKNKKITKSIQIMSRYVLHKGGFPIVDRNRSALSWIMDINNIIGNQVHFFIIPNQTSRFDHNHSINSKKVSGIIREIKQKKHFIGFHPGYNTYDDSENFHKSANLFHARMQEEFIEQPIWGGRQHYLRYNIGKTPFLWDKNGFAYDSTLGYADHSGFRCGTSHEFSMYDLINRKYINLKQRPLIVMDCTIMSEQYEGLGRGDALLNRLNFLKKRCHKYGGTFSLLWHEYNLVETEDRIIYEEIIRNNDRQK